MVWLDYQCVKIVWRWTCSTHTGSGLYGCGGGVVDVIDVIVGVDYWHCLWTSGALQVFGQNFLENGPP